MLESYVSVEKKERRFFIEEEVFIIEHSLEIFWNKLLELKEQDQLPTHLIFLDTSARVFMPTFKKVLEAFYEDSREEIPKTFFLIPDVSEAKKLESKYGEDWKEKEMKERALRLKRQIKWHKERISGEDEYSVGKININKEKRELEKALQDLERLPQEIDEIEKSNWDIKERLAEILKKTKYEADQAHIMVIDDYVFSGIAAKNIVDSANEMGIDLTFFALFFSKPDKTKYREDWERRKNVEKELGPDFFYGCTEDTPTPGLPEQGGKVGVFINFNFQGGATFESRGSYGLFPEESEFAKKQIVGVSKEKLKPKKYSVSVKDDISKDLIAGIRKEAANIGNRVAKKLKK